MEKPVVQHNERTEKKGPEPAKRKQIRFIEEGVKTQYAGVFNINFGAEEVYLSFGNQSMDPSLVRIESKVAISLKTAKRVAVALGDLIRRYEAKNGVLEISPKAAAGESQKDQAGM